MRGIAERKSGMLILVLLLSVMQSGCEWLVIGGIGALGGYVISPDTVEGLTENDPDNVFEAAHDVLSIMGTIIEEHQQGGIIIARVSGTKVTVTISTPAPNTVKLNVKARRTFFPKISTAQDVFVKIMSQLSS